MTKPNKTHVHSRRELILVAVLGFVSLAVGWNGLRPNQPAIATYPDYPRVNTAVCYQADPNWPQRPAHVRWGAVTGVSVDRNDDVWICTNWEPPIQIYDQSGRYIRGWGQGVILDPHQLRIDSEGHVWVVDGGEHVVRKFTTDGKRLLTLGMWFLARGLATGGGRIGNATEGSAASQV